MRMLFLLTGLVSFITLLLSFDSQVSNVSSLRNIYSQHPSNWPAPAVDTGVKWKELDLLPPGPVDVDSMPYLVHLGKILFFDPRLSSSGKISCSSCHQPELSWTDHRDRSLGHEGAINKRNSPTIQNVWFYNKLFWDGRSASLEDQAFAPINSESEMHGDMPGLSRKLKQIKGYVALFDSAYGDPSIDPDRITKALAVFQRTVTSAESRFDKFLKGDKRALSKSELRGLHLFRTKARCMNCHHGPLFSDNGFHQNGFAGDDNGLFFVTHNEADRGKLKTPSLRDVAFTGPWMHDGREKTMEGIIEKYDKAEFFGKTATDKLIRPLGLSGKEKKDLLAFLKAISAPPEQFEKPVLPD